MHVVVHQHVGVQLAAGRKQCFAQQLAITGTVFIVQEAGQAVVAALHDMLRDAGQVEAWKAGHARRFVVCARRSYRRSPQFDCGLLLSVGRK